MAALAELRADVDRALQQRCVRLHEHAARRLSAQGVAAAEMLEVLREAIPCYGVTQFRAADWPMEGLSPQCVALLRTLPAALGDLATGCVLSQRQALGPYAEARASGAGAGMPSVALTQMRATRIAVRLRLRSREGAPDDGPRLHIVLEPGPPPRAAVAAAAATAGTERGG